MRSFHRALAGAAFLAAGLAGTAASAQTPAPAAPAPAPPTPFYDALGPISIAWNVGVANDYAFRGVSQTKENTSVFAGVDASYKEFYLGAWQSNVNFKPFGDNDTDHEIDLYGGWKPTVAGVGLDVGFIYYAYSNQPSYLPDVDYIEGYIKASKAFGPVTVGGSFFYSPEFTGHTGDAEYYEGNLSWAVDKKLTVSGAVGRQEIEKASGYTTWNAGVTYALIDHVSVDLRYWDTDEHGFGKVYGSRFIAGLKYSF